MRTMRFDPDKGFVLNGSADEAQGRVPASRRRLPGRRRAREGPGAAAARRCKEIGVNAIRTSHNPPAPELLDLCDRLGLLVKDEAFDEFTPTKNKWVSGWNEGQPSRFGYGRVFAEWSRARRAGHGPAGPQPPVRDPVEHRQRDRLPQRSVLASRAGRPVSAGESAAPKTWSRARRAADRRREELDPTRPVTAALASIAMSNAVGSAGEARRRRLQLPGGALRRRPHEVPAALSSSAARTAIDSATGRRCATTTTSPASFSGPASTTWARRASGRIAATAPACSTCAASRSPTPGSARACGATSRWSIFVPVAPVAWGPGA